MSGERDTTPALGTRGQPASWRRAQEGEPVAGARTRWGDAIWSFLYGRGDTRYGAPALPPEQLAAANRRGRDAPPPEQVNGPVIKPPVWTWEVPLYFWFGGVASGASFAALACDTAGDARSARIARGVALGAVVPAPLLLIADLGRPGRFLNMLRIFKPRSPMNLGAWALITFSALDAAAVGADLLGLRRSGRALGAVTALVGGYLGSYAGVLLASTAVPLWARSRLLLGPIFVSTATATGAAATRLTLVAAGLERGHPTHRALRTLESGAMVTELTLSMFNERRLDHAAGAMRRGRPGLLFKLARGAIVGGLLLRFARGRAAAPAEHVTSGLFLAGGLAFRYAWVEAGKASARDDLAVARMARGRLTAEDESGPASPRGDRLDSDDRPPLAHAPAAAPRLWTEAFRRTSLAAERLLGTLGRGQ